MLTGLSSPSAAAAFLGPSRFARMASFCSRVLSRRCRDSEDLLENRYDDPLAVLAAITERLLRSEKPLRDFVHTVDAEWGRIFLERPFFERRGRPAHPDDPYTISSVRRALTDLPAGLKSPDEASTDKGPP